MSKDIGRNGFVTKLYCAVHPNVDLTVNSDLTKTEFHSAHNCTVAVRVNQCHKCKEEVEAVRNALSTLEIFKTKGAHQ